MTINDGLIKCEINHKNPCVQTSSEPELKGRFW